MAHIPIWPGSSSFVSGSGQTNFGYFDGDPAFRTAADSVAKFCARKLGYPIVDIELQDINFYTAFEEATLEYSNQINTHSAKDTLLSLLGANTGSLDLASQYIPPSSDGMMKLAEDYGTSAGSGGNKRYYTGSFVTVVGQQIYDLTDDSVASFEHGTPSSGSFTIRKVLHKSPPALVRFFDPFIGTGMGSQNLLEQFGFGGMSPGVSYLMMPMHFDLLRLQAIEFNDQIRRSAYGFELINKRIRLFPVPTAAVRVHFEYTLNTSPTTISELPGGGYGKVSNYSNIPYGVVPYANINSMGTNWIRQFAAALSKETLGNVRAKYSTIPIPNSEITLDGSDLRQAAQAEKEALLEKLRVDLDEFSRKALLERKQAEGASLKDQLNKVPLKLYIA